MHRTVDNGEFSLLLGLIEGLRRDADFQATFFMLSDYFKKDTERIQRALGNQSQVEIVSIKVPFQNVPAFASILRMTLYLPLILKSQAILHLGADGFSDRAVDGRLSTLYHGVQLLLPRFFRKPVLLLSVNIGPFKNAFTKGFASFVLRQINEVSVRQGSTGKYLKEIGFTRFSQVSDLAFLVSEYSDTPKAVLSTKPIVSIVVSRFINQRFPRYTDILAIIVDRMCSRGFHVLIVPQIVYGRFDENSVAYQVFGKVKDKSSVEVLGNLVPSELKKIFSYSRLVVSSKFHSSILSFSSLTPAITLNYELKVKDLHLAMGVPDYLIELTPEFDGLLDSIYQGIDVALQDKTSDFSLLLELNRVKSLETIALVKKWLK